MIRKQILPLILSLMALSASAQQEDDWEEIYQEIYAADDDGDENREADYELLWQLSEHPIDLNRCHREDLSAIPFLSEQQVMDIMEYLERYGPMRSLGELRMIPSLDHRCLSLLPYFVFAGEVTKADTDRFSLKKSLQYGRHNLTLSAHVPFYERQGDRNGYLGYKYRHWMKYEFAHADYLRIGIVGSQDAGEPFFANSNRWGYDTYSYYLQIKKWGAIDQLVVGKYKASAGLGLILGQSFSLGKIMLLQNNARQSTTLRVHSSHSEADYLQGAGATVRLARPLALTAFVSYRPIDASLNDDGTAATLITNGYHRTEAELLKKNNTHMTTAGAMIDYHDNGLQLGANVLYTHLDRSLEPNRTTLYRRYYPHGTDFLNTSLNYAYTHPRFAVSGETAIDRQGHVATLNAASFSPSQNITLLALYRFYSYRYTSLSAHSFSEGSRVQNESGAYLGVNWNPIPRLNLQAYIDYAYAPWARYLISQSSSSLDLLLQAKYRLHRWAFDVRYRGRLRQRDNGDKTQLIANNTHRLRLSATWQPSKRWSAKTQADVAHTFYQKAENGWMLSEHVGYHTDRLQLQLLAAYFHTDSYAARLYVYEQQLRGNFLFPSYYGQGLRLSLTAAATLGRHLTLSAKLGHTHYTDRSVIGNALQQIEASHMEDLALQLRYKF